MQSHVLYTVYTQQKETVPEGLNETSGHFNMCQNACVKLRFNNLITQNLKKIKNKKCCLDIGNAHYNTFNIIVQHIEIY